MAVRLPETNIESVTAIAHSGRRRGVAGLERRGGYFPGPRKVTRGGGDGSEGQNP